MSAAENEMRGESDRRGENMEETTVITPRRRRGAGAAAMYCLVHTSRALNGGIGKPNVRRVHVVGALEHTTESTRAGSGSGIQSREKQLFFSCIGNR